MSKLLFRCMSWYLVFAMFLIGIVPKVYAGFSPSDTLALSQLDRISDLQSIQEILETKMIITRLKEFGLSRDEIQARLGRLSNQQIHQLALRLDEIKLGRGAFEVLVVILLIGILVGIWFQITGRTVVVQSK